MAPVLFCNSANDVGKTACAWPAAAQTTSKASSASSMIIISGGVSQPNGETPPIEIPEAFFTKSASARCNFSTPKLLATVFIEGGKYFLKLVAIYATKKKQKRWRC